MSQADLVEYARNNNYYMSTATVKRAETGAVVSLRTAMQFTKIFKEDIARLTKG